MNIKGEWIWRTIISILFAAVVWFAKGSYEEQKAYNKSVDSRVSLLELEQAKASGSRFTSADWMSGKSTIDSTFASHDKRITRVEDAVVSLKETLPRIERKLDELAPRK